MKLLRLQPINGRPEGYGSIRACDAGRALSGGRAWLSHFAQPFLWVVLGSVWGFALFGRFISMMSDTGGRKGGPVGGRFYGSLAALVEFLLAAGPLLYAFSFIS